jgi:L-2-hydroxyglutarate oxidase LhgO
MYVTTSKRAVGCRSEAETLIGFQGTGSLLIARTAEEAAALRVRQHALARQGLSANLLGPKKAAQRCPALAWGPDSLALEVPSDEQVRPAVHVFQPMQTSALAARVALRYSV